MDATDHTGPHGRCAITTDLPDCTCPDIHYSASRGWYCTCCDGDTTFGGLEPAELLIYALYKLRIAKAIRRHDRSPALAHFHGRLTPADS